MTYQSSWTYCKDSRKLADSISQVAPDAEVTSGVSNRGNPWVNVESSEELPYSIHQAAEENGYCQMWNDPGYRAS